MLVVNTILLSGGHNLPKALPQLRSRERAAHTGNVLNFRLAKSGKNSRRNSNGFRSGQIP